MLTGVYGMCPHTFFLLANLDPETSVLKLCIVRLALHRGTSLESENRPRTTRVFPKVQTVLEEQTGSRFALGPTVFSDGAHTEVFFY